MSSSTSVVSSRPPVVVLFNQASPGTRPENRAAELGVLEAVGSAVAALGRAGHSVETLGLGDDFLPLVNRLRASPAVVVNFCEGLAGRAQGEAHVAGVLELMGVPYTGSTPEAILLCLDKIRTKRLLGGCGLPTPPYFEFQPNHGDLDAAELEKELIAHQVRWPVVVKPAQEDASQGIHQGSVAQNVRELLAAVEHAANCYGFPVLVEQYIAGREFNVAVIEHPTPVALPITEIVFEPSERLRWSIVTYDAKWDTGGEEDRATVPHCPADLDQKTALELKRLALEAIRFTGCRDYARIDVRLSSEGQPYILEVNANPDLSPSGGLDRQLVAAGISHDEFIVRLVERALGRRSRAHQGVACTAVATGKPAKPKALSNDRPSVELRPLLASDREPIRQLLVRCGNFRPDEIEVGVELVDEALSQTGVEHYQFVIATVEGRVVGYSCFGPVPMTDGVWDLYWIAAAPTVQGLGVGARLQAATERQIKSSGGRLVLAETSSIPSYAAARAFYLRQGYQLLERLADFYRLGDDRLTFGKRL